MLLLTLRFGTGSNPSPGEPKPICTNCLHRPRPSKRLHLVADKPGSQLPCYKQRQPFRFRSQAQICLTGAPRERHVSVGGLLRKQPQERKRKEQTLYILSVFIEFAHLRAYACEKHVDDRISGALLMVCAIVAFTGS